MNRFNPAHPLGQKEVETTLAKTIFAKIPADDKTFERIEMTAQDLFQVAPNSPAARAVMELAALLMPQVDAVEAPAGGMLSRMMSAFTPS